MKRRTKELVLVGFFKCWGWGCPTFPKAGLSLDIPSSLRALIVAFLTPGKACLFHLLTSEFLKKIPANWKLHFITWHTKANHQNWIEDKDRPFGQDPFQLRKGAVSLPASSVGSYMTLSFFMNWIHVILHPEKIKELHTRKSPSFHRPEHNLRLPRYAPTTLASHTDWVEPRNKQEENRISAGAGRKIRESDNKYRRWSQKLQIDMANAHWFTCLVADK